MRSIIMAGKDKIIHMRVSIDDEKRWRNEAEKLGLTLSSYIRLKLNLDVMEQKRHRIDQAREDEKTEA
jgi:predicted DNA binding CopG/RHH family protein